MKGKTRSLFKSSKAKPWKMINSASQLSCLSRFKILNYDYFLVLHIAANTKNLFLTDF